MIQVKNNPTSSPAPSKGYFSPQTFQGAALPNSSNSKGRERPVQVGRAGVPGVGGGQTAKQVSPSELAADSLQQASLMTPRKAAAKAGRKMVWKHAVSKDFIF